METFSVNHRASRRPYCQPGPLISRAYHSPIFMTSNLTFQPHLNVRDRPFNHTFLNCPVFPCYPNPRGIVSPCFQLKILLQTRCQQLGTPVVAVRFCVFVERKKRKGICLESLHTRPRGGSLDRILAGYGLANCEKAYPNINSRE